ncbi:energy-coupling factor transporter transmembrane protein EcfT [Leptotrichia sp. OH3620_COT-345]|uniref:energy-coupling factor transporter transmembrane component T n=1 Tax=Leptotrichia sp. OH3620_COT-345 TaxID=2491048 RepID=UPI000F645C01|nr:energy-coupling factor transporter transmembrane component T [Leptotrichia sp. OH3620_COT-345]RRD38883.1 energy-coupling factor transporter transmembrane protein EcfT [Leptotrichia sp. OH3620_COT-345]
MEKNIFRRLYPTTKLMMTFTLIMSAFVIPGYIYSYLIFLICGIIVYFCGKLKEYTKQVFKSLILLFIIIFIIQGILISKGEIWFKLGFISVYKEGIMKGVNLTSKITAFVSAFTMFFQITPIRDFVISLEKAGMNSKAAYVVLLTLQIIPEMMKRTNVIMDSQKARGVETESNIFVRAKAFIPIFFPLILSSIENTEERAITLEARGFSSGVKKTRLYDIEKVSYDLLFRILLVVFIVLCIIWRKLWNI